MYLFFTFLIVVIAGIVAKYALPKLMAADSGYTYRRADHRCVTWAEIAVGAVLIALPVIFVTGAVAKHVSVNSQLTKHEYFNGYEKSVAKQVTTCHRDGSCHHTYSCDPHTEVYTTTDSKGHVTTHTRTVYHHCPYTSTEWTFVIGTSLGNITVADHVLPENPTDHYWRRPGGFFHSGDHIPGNLIRSAGYPEVWNAAKKRLAAGHPGPVTQVHDYKNYILASDQTIFAKWSDEIADFRKRGLMPDPAAGTYNVYRAHKFHTVKLTTDTTEWNDRLETFNAILGTKLQGDMQIVAVDSSKLSRAEAQDYTDALIAEWVAPHRKRDVVAKNSIVLVLGVSGNTVAWSKAETAMPVGNELMSQKLSELDNTPFTPDAILGRVNEVSAGQAPSLTEGAVSEIVFHGPTKYERPCMECKGKGEDAGNGFEYLKGDVHPSTTSLVVAGLISLLLSFALWVLLYNVDMLTWPVIGPAIRKADDFFTSDKTSGGENENQS